ncbi:MAG: ATP-grasp domain-containing protein [Actinobacteria bacterium]|nr:ATP-grasp domain-containing protein [Actinomycetota bacterium]
MNQEFPLLGVISPNFLYRSMIGPALALGLDLRLLGTQLEQIKEKKSGCDLVTVLGSAIPISTIRTLESATTFFRPNSTALAALLARFPNSENDNDTDLQIEVLAARSPHSQACAWAPTELIFRNGLHRLSVAPVAQLADATAVSLQRIALDAMQENEIVGVASFVFHKVGTDFIVKRAATGPSSAGNWTTDASTTGQFEQHLRAILDLPLGDPGISAKFVATGNFVGAKEKNMYRPYLHLMARSPELKMHQYRDSDAIFAGHVTSSGNKLQNLTETIWHALDYLDGEIDE